MLFPCDFMSQVVTNLECICGALFLLSYALVSKVLKDVISSLCLSRSATLSSLIE